MLAQKQTVWALLVLARNNGFKMAVKDGFVTTEILLFLVSLFMLSQWQYKST